MLVEQWKQLRQKILALREEGNSDDTTTYLFKVVVKALDVAVYRSFLQPIEVSIKPNKVQHQIEGERETG